MPRAATGHVDVIVSVLTGVVETGNVSEIQKRFRYVQLM